MLRFDSLLIAISLLLMAVGFCNSWSDDAQAAAIIAFLTGIMLRHIREDAARENEKARKMGEKYNKHNN